MKKFVQEFRRAVRENRFEERLLIEEFKKEMNRIIRSGTASQKYQTIV